MPIVNAQITKHGVYTTDKNKQPLLNRQNKPYARVAIKTDVYGDNKWLSAFSNFADDQIRKWQVGERHDILVEEKNGFLNFSVPKAEDKAIEQVGQHEKLIAQLIREMGIVKRYNPNWFAAAAQANAPSPIDEIPEINIDDEIKPEDLPF